MNINIAKRIISVHEDKKILFFERRLNNITKHDLSDDIRLIASNFEKSFENVLIYDIDYKPKDFDGYFCPVILEPDGDVVLLETDLEFATYDISKERLDASKWPKIIPTNFCVFSIDENSNKLIVESNLTRITAKQMVQELNLKSSSLEYDYEIEEEFLNSKNTLLTSF
ncbi:MAG: hypothetical protein PHE16_02930 [Aliarcobacter sp.]|nr:hypothetical protein [Aliarcobacter sp.]